MAILKKLTLIKSVANSRFGAFIRVRILSSVLEPDDFSSSISFGVSEKKADSAADTNATKTNNANIPIIANTVLAENVFNKILLRGAVLKR